MFTITISAQALQNLKAFMGRINLSAKEVNSYVEVMNILAMAKGIESKAETITPEKKTGKKGEK